jgi:hypothetical protein
MSVPKSPIPQPHFLSYLIFTPRLERQYDERSIILLWPSHLHLGRVQRECDRGISFSSMGDILFILFKEREGYEAMRTTQRKSMPLNAFN